MKSTFSLKSDRRVNSPKGNKSPKSLIKVLEQNEHIKELVEECVEDLSSVNTVLKRELAQRDAQPGVEHALQKGEAVENKALDASQKLSAVNLALQSEVRDRNILEHQFAAVVEQEEAARHAAFHDVLTGLPNRALFADRLEHGLAQAKRHRWTLAVMFIDLDRFKRINDTYGHDAGDRVLHTIAGRLQENARGDDTVGRLGGDEFLYLLTEIREEKNIELIAQKVIKTIQAPCKVSIGDLNISPSITASIGIAIYPKDGTSADSLVNSADKAMYRAKQEKSGYAFSG